jgi:hypothetical protein
MRPGLGWPDFIKESRWLNLLSWSIADMGEIYFYIAGSIEDSSRLAM